jgi:predicted subunit of tRNA(5-methylaminomethyl-2-thiouridylate) methyltransferase
MAAVAKAKNETPKIPLDKIKEMWENREALFLIIHKTGIHQKSLEELAKEHGWVKIKRSARNIESDYTPTLEEIAEVTAAIRATWSDEETERRYHGKKRKEMTIPTVTFDLNSRVFLPSAVSDAL